MDMLDHYLCGLKLRRGCRPKEQGQKDAWKYSITGVPHVPAETGTPRKSVPSTNRCSLLPSRKLMVITTVEEPLSPKSIVEKSLAPASGFPEEVGLRSIINKLVAAMIRNHGQLTHGIPWLTLHPTRCACSRTQLRPGNRSSGRWPFALRGAPCR